MWHIWLFEPRLISGKNGQSENTCLATDCGWVGIGGALGLANSKSGCSKFNSFLAVVVFFGPATGLGRKDLLRGFLSKCGTAFRSEIDCRWMGGWNEGSFRSVIGGAACKLEQGYDEFFLEITKYFTCHVSSTVCFFLFTNQQMVANNNCFS